MEPAVRVVDQRHLESHRRLRREMLVDAPDEFWETLAEADALTDADWRRDIELRTFLQALDETGAVVGQVGVLDEPYTDEHDLPADAVNIVGMYVSPSARGSGVSTRLMQAAADLARDRGRPVLMLDVSSGAARAIRFYERMGFQQTGVTEPHPRRDDLVWVQYRLDPSALSG
ncbi:GNAT family N-acetyltransferase [Helcobacillus massiliensis]